MKRFLIFDTHPIQYRSPVFACLAAKHPQTLVCFFNERFNSKRWWFREVGKIPKQAWELSLQEGFPSQVLGTSGWSWWQTIIRLARLLDEKKPTHVVLYGYYLPEHWIVRLLCGWKSIPLLFVGETFETGSGSVRAAIKKPLRRFFFQGVERFITIGKKTWEYYRNLGIEEARLVSAKYCVDHRFFTRSADDAKEDRKRWREALGIPQDAFVSLFVGRLFERKRPHDMLRIQEHLAHLEGLHTVFVGNGPLESELRAAGTRVPRTHFLGFQNQSQTRNAYYGADVLIVPSEFETWGLVVNEAAHCGRPAIITASCGVAGDLTKQGETGFVFKKGDLKSALSYVEKLYGDRSLARKLGAVAQQRVTQEYSVDGFSDAFLRAAGLVT